MRETSQKYLTMKTKDVSVQNRIDIEVVKNDIKNIKDDVKDIKDLLLKNYK